MTGKTKLVKPFKPIYYSTRIRLTEEQREKLSNATISDLTSLIKELLSTHKSIPLITILRLQTSLGVEIISRNELVERFIEYLDYIFSPTFLNYDKADRLY